MRKFYMMNFLVLGFYLVMSSACNQLIEDDVLDTQTMFIVGGYDSSGRYQHDVWSSLDGSAWEEKTPKGNATKEISAKENLLFERMSSHEIIQFRNFLIIIGGQFHKAGSIPQVKDDVWLSLNGKRWIRVKTDTKEPAGRYSHDVVVFKNAIFVIGGTDGTRQLNDVWSSIDAENWDRIKANDDTGFEVRDSHHVVVFNNKMFLIGGSSRCNIVRKGFTISKSNCTIKNDVWSSADGKTWHLMNDGTNSFPIRSGYAVVVFQGKIFVIGGLLNGRRFNDVWSSENGETWKEVKPNDDTGFSARSSHTVLVYNGAMYLIGGNTGGKDYQDTTNYKNDVWSSTDGKTWKEVKPNNDKGFTPRIGHRTTVLNIRE